MVWCICSTGRDATRPWEGRAPWQTAQLSGALLAGVERQLAGEAESASGYVMPTPDVGDKGQAADADGEDDPLTALRRDLAAAARSNAPRPVDGRGIRRRAGRVAYHVTGISRQAIRDQPAHHHDRTEA